MQKLNKGKLIIVITLITIISLLFVTLKTNNKYEELPEVKLNKIEKERAMAIMISEDGSKYKEYESETWPGKEYVFKKAECVDNAGNRIEGAITFNNETGKATLTSKKTIYCTLYFDYKGTGEETLPYRIQYIEDLIELQIKVNSGETYAGKYFELERNLDFNKESDYRDYQSKDYGDINGNEIDEDLKTELTSGNGWKPIGDSKTNSFQGIFDGNDYTLANIYIHNTIKEESEIGLFGYIENSVVKNLKVTGEMTTTLMNDIGGIAGNIENTTIDTCESNVKITSDVGNYSLGGITGGVEGEKSIIKNCINRGNITNGNNTGGIVGINVGNLTINNSHNEGNITNIKGQHIGGLLGRDDANTNTTTIINSSNNGTIISNREIESETYSGGLVGIINGTIIINKSHNSGEVRNDRTTYTKTLDIQLGGLVGRITGNDKNINKITNSYNEGHLVGATKQGGILGYNVTKAITIIDGCYNKGVNESQVIAGGNQTTISGIVGYNNGNSKLYILNSYNEGNITSIINAQGIAYTDFGATTHIINSYNIGNINGDKWTGGIFVAAATASNGIANTVKLNNVYNLGNVIGSNAYELGFRNGNTAIVEITNSYYEETKNGTNISNVGGTPLALNNIKNQTFVDTLNNNMYKIKLESIDPILKDYKLNGWVLGNDGYPVFAKEVEDLSGNGRNGISFAVDWTKDGITTSTDENNVGYVDCGLANYNFEDSLSFVVRVKINKQQTNITQRIIGNWENGGGGLEYEVSNKISLNLYGMDLDPASYRGISNTNTTINTTNWYTIIGNYDGKEISLYINGEKEKSVAFTGRIKPTEMPILIGANPNPSGNSYIPVEYGYITVSDALIFDRALSEEEIKENYVDVPNPANKDELLLWYKFN